MTLSVTRQFLVVGGGLLGLMVLAVLGSQVGGIAIRSAAVDTDPLSLTLSEPALRGAVTALQWQPEATNQPLSFFIRDANGEQLVGQADGNTGEARLLLQCRGDDQEVALLARHTQANQVIATRSLTILPPGRDCFLR